MKHSETCSGFTLIELMIAIGIIAIAAAVAVPNIIGWLPNYRLKAASRDLYSNFQKARMQAVKENRSIRVIFDSSTTPGFYYFDMNTDGAFTAGEPRFDLASYPNGIDYGSGSAVKNWNNDPCNTAASITFNNRGTANGISGSVYLENQDKDICYAVTATTSGSIRLRKFGSGAWN